MHKIAWYLLILLYLGLNGPRPATLDRPGSDSGQRVQSKAYPISLRYRQLIQQQIDLPPTELSRPCPQQGQPSARLVPRGADLSPDVALLLMRMQV